MRWRRSNSALSVLALLSGIFVASPVSRAQAPPPAPLEGATPDLNASVRDLQLEVFINGSSTHLVGAFRQIRDGCLVANPDEVHDIGLKPAREALDADGLIHLDRLKGVSYRVQESTQRLYVTAPNEALVPHLIDVSPKPADDMPEPQRGLGGLLNYTLFANSDGLSWSNLYDYRGLSGTFDAHMFTPYGTLSQSVIAGSASDDREKVTRLETTWTYSDPRELITYRAGDMISGGLSWTRPVWLGGVQVQRNFALRPDLVTLPIPALSGSAAVPSTLDVYTQDVRTFSGEVPAGPFQVTNLPVITGAGTARVVLHDALGRETVTTLPFYASSQLLREGLYDFSAEVGWARQFYGTESNDYDQRPMASASARYGLSNWLTLEGHAEGGTSLLNAGMGSAFLVDPFGVVSLALAGSQTGGGTGGLINASLETGFEGLGGLTLYARTQMTFGDYEDIASVTTPHDWRVDESSLFNARVPKSLNQISLGLPLPFDRSVLNLSYTELDSGCGDHYQIAGVSYTHSIFGNATMFASVFKDFDDGNNFSAYVGISVPLGGDITVTGDVQYGSDGVSAGGDAMKSQGIEEGSYGWRVHDEEGEITDRSATASYRTSFAQLAGSVQQYGDSFHVTGEMDGSIAYAGGDLFFGNRIDDAFAVVDAGAPNVTVQYENRLVGETDSHGLIFVPSLNSYQRNKITIDPKNLPIDADVPETKQIVVPADRSGVVVKFGVAENPKAALITFVDEEKKPIGVGAIARLDTSSDTFIVGYDGQAYLRGLAARNSVTIERPDGGSCHAEFSYTPQPGQQVTIGNVICR